MISRSDFLKILNCVSSGCDGDTSSLTFKDGKVYSWSPSISMTMILPEGAEELEGIINGSDLIRYLSRLTSSAIDIECDDDCWIIKSGTSTCTIRLIADDSHTEQLTLMNGETKTWLSLPYNFISCLDVCILAGNDGGKIGGIYTKGKDMVSTDNCRVVKATLSSAVEQPFLMSTFASQNLTKCTGAFTEYALTHRWIYFRTEDNSTVMACSRMDESVYDCDLYMGLVDSALENCTVEGTLPNLTNTLNLAQVFDNVVELGRGDTMRNAITLKFTSNCLYVSSARGSNGKFSERIAYTDEVLHIDDPIIVQITATFLSSAMKHTNRFSLSKVGRNSLFVMKGDFFTICIFMLEN